MIHQIIPESWFNFLGQRRMEKPATGMIAAELALESCHAAQSNCQVCFVSAIMTVLLEERILCMFRFLLSMVMWLACFISTSIQGLWEHHTWTICWFVLPKPSSPWTNDATFFMIPVKEAADPSATGICVAKASCNPDMQTSLL